MTHALEEKYAHLEDPGMREFLIAGERFYPADAVNFTMAEQRAFYDRYCAHFKKPRPSSVVTEDFPVGSCSCRAYRKSGAALAPVMLYIHGGGHVLGGLESHDDVCAEICDRAGIEVVALNYRLAPEHVFPAALDDCEAVLRRLAASHDRIIVGGDSAGGNLSVALGLRMRDQKFAAIRGLVVVYAGLGGDVSKGSYVTQAHAPGHSTADVIYYRKTYGGGGSKYALPLHETDYRDLPPTYLVAAGLDSVHDDSFEFAARLSAAGVPSKVRDEPMLVHAFLRARHMSAPAKASFAAIVEAARSLAYEGVLPAL